MTSIPITSVQQMSIWGDNHELHFKTQANLPVKWLSLLYNFNENWNQSTDSGNPHQYKT